jgi:hypothetical protein
VEWWVPGVERNGEVGEMLIKGYQILVRKNKSKRLIGNVMTIIKKHTLYT